MLAVSAKMRVVVATLLVFMVHCNYAHSTSERLNVAVSANFFAPFLALKQQLQDDCDCLLIVTPGASGVLAAQFANGAPFDIFLSADQAKPNWLYNQGHTAMAPVDYAIGRLVLLDKHRTDVSINDIGVALDYKAGTWQIAIANAKTAPYGEAAEHVLKGNQNANNSRIVRGNSIMQVMQFFETGAVDQALVAASLLTDHTLPFGSAVLLPEHLHNPIIQQLVINKRANISLAKTVVNLLRSTAYQARLHEWGYMPLYESEL